MSSSGRDTPKLYLINNAHKPKNITLQDAQEFAQARGFEWCNELKISAEDSKKVVENLGKIGGLTQFGSDNDHLAFWISIYRSHRQMDKMIAIYDTQDPKAGLGLLALNDIAKDQFLIYWGEWSFFLPGEHNQDKDPTYVFSIEDKNQKPFGNIDSIKYRHLAAFAMHAWDSEKDLDQYWFSSPEIRKNVALANMEMLIVPRPKGIHSGPPLLLALRTKRVIKKREPFLWNYDLDFLLGNKKFQERFFDKHSGLIIDPKHYHAKANLHFRIADTPGKFAFDFQATLAEIEGGHDFQVETKDGATLIVSNEEIRTIVATNPGSRFFCHQRSNSTQKEIESKKLETSEALKLDK